MSEEACAAHPRALCEPRAQDAAWRTGSHGLTTTPAAAESAWVLAHTQAQAPCQEPEAESQTPHERRGKRAQTTTRCVNHPMREPLTAKPPKHGAAATGWVSERTQGCLPGCRHLPRRAAARARTRGTPCTPRPVAEQSPRCGRAGRCRGHVTCLIRSVLLETGRWTRACVQTGTCGTSLVRVRTKRRECLCV